MPYPPLEAKLKKSGGDLSRILHPRAAGDLDRLEAGKRYKFVVDEKGQLAIAPMPADAHANEYVHPILGGGAPVETAGGITVERDQGKLSRVVIDQDSQAYCPTLASLEAAKRALETIGVPAALVVTRDQPPKCK